MQFIDKILLHEMYILTCINFISNLVILFLDNWSVDKMTFMINIYLIRTSSSKAYG